MQEKHYEWIPKGSPGNESNVAMEGTKQTSNGKKMAEQMKKRGTTIVLFSPTLHRV